eukprot:Rmarinus@m.15016
MSSSSSIAISLLSEADQPGLDCAYMADTVEDVLTHVALTPLASLDTDLSDASRKLLLHDVLPHRAVIESASDAVEIEGSGVVFTLSSMDATGFAYNVQVAGVLAGAAVDCDIDFTVSATMFAVEENGKSHASSVSTSIGVSVFAIADIPDVMANPFARTTEDAFARLVLTPALVLDTDLSVSRSGCSLPQPSPDCRCGSLGDLGGFTFASVSGSTSSVSFATYTISMGGSGFLSHQVLTSHSVSVAVQCDADFTLGFGVVAVEENGKDTHRSTSTSIGILVRADADVPLVQSDSTTQTSEDMPVKMSVTPVVGSDTDFSDALRKLVMCAGAVLVRAQRLRWPLEGYGVS